LTRWYVSTSVPLHAKFTASDRLSTGRLSTVVPNPGGCSGMESGHRWRIDAFCPIDIRSSKMKGPVRLSL
jgi:hypothetical protein